VKVPISSIYRVANGTATFSFTAAEERGFVSAAVVITVETRAMSEGGLPPEASGKKSEGGLPPEASGKKF
jgi:hypothetical protein